MNMRKILSSSLLAGGLLALLFRLAGRLLTARVVPEPGARTYEALDSYVEEQMRRLHIPGASLAVVEGDRIVHLRGFGRARPGGETPGPETPFFIGSLTKSITALAVMQLVEAGRVDLDAPVQRCLPWFRLADPGAAAQVTVRHLLNQTSGLPLWPSEVASADFDDRTGAVERQVRALATLKTGSPPGAKCEYSNFNYNILGLVIEAASGEAYADYLQKHIFEPLGMQHTFTSKAEAKRCDLAGGHRHWFSMPIPAPDLRVPAGSLPSGQLSSCAQDMARYLIAHLNGGRCGQAQILSPAGIAELHRGAADLEFMGVKTGRYGMGWFDTDLDGVRVYSHSGNVPDFSAFMALVPECRRGVVLLFNADPYGLPVVTEEVGMGAAALLAGRPPAPVRLDFIQWVMRLLPLIPLLQGVEALASLRALQRWRDDPQRRPRGGRLWGRHILLPLLPNLAMAGILAALQSSGMIRFFHLFMPDIAWTARISGGFGGIWAVVRTGLILRAAGKYSEPIE